MASKANWPYVINMGNSIIGVTVLAMPFCFRQCGVLLGMLLLIGSSCLTYLSCSLLVKAAHTSRKRSYEFLAFHSFGSVGKLAVEFSIIGLLIGTCIAFYVIIGDLGPAIISKMTGLENTSGLRTSLMVILALCVVLPLGLLRDLHSLSNVSAISLCFYMVFVAEVCSAALPNLWSGVWVTKVVYWNPEGVFRCLPIFSLAFACQTQLFLMYDSLPEPSLKRMSTITKNAIGLSAAVYLLVGYFGYVAFCDEDISGDVLMNFRPTIFSEAVKLGFVLSVATSFPFVIFPCRAALYTLLFAQVEDDDEEGGSHDHLGGPMAIPETKFKVITFAIVIATLIVGIKVPNIEFVLAITGATMGSMICFIFPAIMFISVMSISQSKFVAQMVLFIGVTVLLASTYVTLNGVDNAALAQESVVKIAQSADELAKPPVVLPTPVTPANKEGVDVNKLEQKRAGDDVIKDVLVPKGSMKPETKVEEKDKKKDEKRQEPPYPHAPPDTGEQKDPDTKDGREKKADADGVKKQEAVKDAEKGAEKGAEKEPTKDAEKKVAEKAELKSHKAEKQKAVEKKSGETKKDTNAEAKILLKELKVQHAVQEKLIEQQKEIIQELKQHQKEAHQDKPAEQQPGQQQVQIQQQQVPVQQQQQQVPVQQQQQQVPVQQQQQQEPVQQQQQQIPVQQQQQQVPVQQQQQQVPVQQQQQQVPVQQQQVPMQQQQQQVPVQQQQQQVPVQQQQQQVPVQQQQQQVQVQQQQQVPVQQQQVPMQQQQVPVQQQQQVPMQQQQQQVPVQQQQQQVPVQQQQQQVPVQQQQVPMQQQQQQVPVQQQQQVPVQQQQVPVQQQQQQIPVQQQQVPQQFDPQNMLNVP